MNGHHRGARQPVKHHALVTLLSNRRVDINRAVKRRETVVAHDYRHDGLTQLIAAIQLMKPDAAEKNALRIFQNMPHMLALSNEAPMMRSYAQFAVHLRRRGNAYKPVFLECSITSSTRDMRVQRIDYAVNHACGPDVLAGAVILISHGLSFV